MGDYLRAFCRSDDLPPLGRVNDIDDDGYDAAGAFLGFFVERCGGMIQADGEGFYEGDRLIVKLE